jgi:hypothetical protein
MFPGPQKACTFFFRLLQYIEDIISVHGISSLVLRSPADVAHVFYQKNINMPDCNNSLKSGASAESVNVINLLLNLKLLQNVCLPRMILSGIHDFGVLPTGFRLKACRNDNFWDFCIRLNM